MKEQGWETRGRGGDDGGFALSGVMEREKSGWVSRTIRGKLAAGFS